MMEVKELRGKSREELGDELLKLRKEQFALRMQRATGQAVKPDQFGKVRKNIARVKTVLRESAARAASGEKA
jgi:large subunit ribosomal protein L29